MIAWAKKAGMVGVDLGSQSVKLAQIEQSGGKTILRAASSIPRKRPLENTETTQSNARTSQEEISSAKVLSGSFRGRAAAAVVSMTLCDLRQLSVTDGTPDEVQDAIQRELEMQGHSSLIGQQFDYWDVRVQGEAHPPRENINVLSLATTWAEQIADDLSRSKLRCMLINGLPHAMAHAIQLSGQAADETTAVVDWGYNCATFCLVHLGRPIFVRELRRCGLHGFVQAIAKALDVSADEAQVILRKHGFVEASSAGDELGALLGNIMTRPLGQVIEEIKRTLIFLKSHRRVAAAKSLVVTGGGAVVPNSIDLLNRHLPVGVHSWQSPHLVVSDEVEEDLPLAQFASAIALSSLAWGK